MSNVSNKPVTLVLAVAVTCIVAAAGLGATYAITKDRIAVQDKLAQENSLRAVMPDAETFEEITDQDVLKAAQKAAGEVRVGVADTEGNVANAIFRALDDKGELLGWGIRLGSRGYGGYAQIVIGMDTSGEVTGVSILSHGETAGLGTKVMENPDYLAQFKELPQGFTDKDVRKIDAIAGATKSSNSVKHTVTAAGAIYEAVLSKGGE